jgi:membrane associated rhomboid family serine protease
MKPARLPIITLLLIALRCILYFANDLYFVHNIKNKASNESSCRQPSGRTLLTDLERTLRITNDRHEFLKEVREGEVWRLAGAMFLHSTTWHLLLNMITLLILGRIIEPVMNRFYYALLLVFSGSGGNLGQYYLYYTFDHTRDPACFGGMSGAIFGLVGFIWIVSELRPRPGFHIEPHVIRGVFILSMIWFALGWLQIIPNVANMAHTGGLLSGLLLGFMYAVVRRRHFSSRS